MITKVTENDIQKMKNIIASGISMTTTSRSINLKFGWRITNLSNYDADYTVLILSFEEAVEVIFKVTGERWDLDEVKRISIGIKVTTPLYLHLGAKS